MRLTLRTLLAYLDEILDPEDAGELGAKIRESDFASSLVHRIRSVCGRLRLSSPPPVGRGLGADPNSVAEYLDNTLPAERVPEFEKVCLESDMHLSEVASCHQVLALVLGEPAQVDAGLRQRMHGLPRNPGIAKSPVTAEPAIAPATDGVRRRIDQVPQAKQEKSGWRGEPVATAATAPAAAQPRETAMPAAPSASEPESSRRLPGLLAALCAGALVTAAALFAWQSLRPQNAPGPEVAADSAPLAEPNVAVELPPAGAPAEFATPTEFPTSEVGQQELARDSGFQPAGPAPSNSVAANAVQPPIESAPVQSVPFAPPLVEAEGQPPGTRSDLNTHTNPAELAVTGPEATGVGPTANGLGPAVSSEPPMAAAQPMPDFEFAPSNPDALAAVENSSRELGGSPDRSAPPEPLESPAAMIEPAEALNRETSSTKDSMPTDMGRFVSEHQLLAVWNPVEGAWRQLPAMSSLMEGYRLRVPTLYRPHLVLSNGIQLTLNSRSEVQLDHKDVQPLLRVAHGQAILSAIGEATPEVDLQVGEQIVRIKMTGSQAQFAMEVFHRRELGTELTAPGPRVLHIWPVAGQIEVQQGDDSVALGNGQMYVMRDTEVSLRENAVVPKWVESPRRRDIDRAAMTQLTSSLAADRSLTLTLFEATKSKRSEVSSLAARCLASMDGFKPLLGSFTDLKQRSAWQSHFEELIAATARGPETGALLIQAAQEQWGADAERFVEVVQGFDPDRLSRGGAATLVDMLNEDQLVARVLAAESLRQITGATRYYRPEQSPARRRDSIRKWRRALDSGDIAYKQWPVMAGL